MDVLEFKANVKGRWKVIDKKNQEKKLTCIIEEREKGNKKIYYIIGFSLLLLTTSVGIYIWKKDKINDMLKNINKK